MKKFARFPVVLLLCLIWTGCAKPPPDMPRPDGTPTNEREAAKVLESVQDAYEKSDYRSAVIQGESLLTRFPDSRYVPDTYRLVGDSYYQMDEYELSANAYRNFVDRFPGHPMAAEIHHSLGYAELALDNPATAATSLMAFLRLSDDFREKQSITTVLSTRIFPRLDIADMQQLLRNYPFTAVSDELALRLIEKNVTAERFEIAATEIEQFYQNYPQSPYRSDVDALRAAVQQGGNVTLTPLDQRDRTFEETYDSPFDQSLPDDNYPPSEAYGTRIGVVCPVSGKYGRFGSSVLKGVEMAVADYQRSSGETVEFVVRDSKGHALEAMKATRELIYNEKVVGIIGPILSESVISAGAMAQQAGVPLITPTATDMGISQIGDHVFQFNNTLADLGQAIARYALEELGIYSFSILHPQSSYGFEMARGFADEISRSGATILDVVLYPAGQTDFQEQIKALKEKQPEALFVPAEDSDILLIAPQLNHYNMETTLLGGNGWNSPRLVRTEANNVDGAYFVDNYYNQSSYGPFVGFKQAFFDRYNIEPDKVSAFSYDATRLMLEGIQRGAETPAELQEQITHMGRYEGISGYVTITPQGRIYKYPQIFMIQGGTVVETYWVRPD